MVLSAVGIVVPTLAVSGNQDSPVRRYTFDMCPGQSVVSYTRFTLLTFDETLLFFSRGNIPECKRYFVHAI